MGVAERRAREKDDLKRKILDTAAELFIEQGYENVSMRKIANRNLSSARSKTRRTTGQAC